MAKVKGKLEKKSAKKDIKSYSRDELSRRLIMGLVGLVLILIPNDINKIIGIIVGIIILIIGLSSVYSYFKNKLNYMACLISGILYTLLGFIILISPSSVIRSIAIGIGIIFIITGLSKIKLSFSIKSINSNWIATLLIGIIIIILGIVLIFNPFSGDAITKFVGIFLVVVAIFDLIDNCILRK